MRSMTPEPPDNPDLEQFQAWVELAELSQDPDFRASVRRPDDVVLRRRLLTRLKSVNDPRRERYLRLLAVINGGSVPESLAPVLAWSVQALRVRVRR